jgi:regulator of sirC expression with transglutaminase-like and TPR domain
MVELECGENLFRAAFAITLHERPEADLAATETIIENLTDTIRKRIQSKSPQALLAHLHDVLFDVFELSGNSDDYYNPANSYLPEVLRSRKGIPITLALVYKRVAELLGIAVHGINAPGHFLVEVETSSEGSMYVDPFYGGNLLDENDIMQRIAQATGQLPSTDLPPLARASNRQWLTRMLNNLQAAFASRGQERDVLAMQELHDLVLQKG